MSVLLMASAFFLAIWSAMDQLTSNNRRALRRQKWPPVTVLSDDASLFVRADTLRPRPDRTREYSDRARAGDSSGEALT
jgi:hypothetical protein